MPILRKEIVWLAGCAGAGLLAALIHNKGFGWPLYLTVAAIPFIFVLISQVVTASALRRLRLDFLAASDHTDNLAELHSGAPHILREYAALLAKFPDCVMDSSWLPVSKEQMLEVIRFSWLQTDSTKLRDWLETGWTLLGWFQDGVGQNPIDIRRNLLKTLRPRALDAREKERGKWMGLVVSEMESLNRERNLFIKSNAKITASREAPYRA